MTRSNENVPRLLIVSRALRGIGQGMMLADFTLYLKALGWSGAGVGFLLTCGALGEIIASVFVGWRDDRGSKKQLLILGELLSFVAFCLAWYSVRPPVLAAAALLGGLGQRSNGSPGPFSPAEQSLFAYCLPISRLGGVLSINSATGFAGLGIGALIAMAVIGAPRSVVGSAAFRPLLIISAVFTLINIGLLQRLAEPQRDPSTTVPLEAQPSPTRTEAQSLGCLVLTNLLNGAAIGMADLLVPYWFANQFHATPTSISLLMSVTYFFTALLACAAAIVVYRTGHLTLLLGTQFMSAGLLLLFPLLPVFWLAYVALAARYALTRSLAGVRQTLTNALVRRASIGFATSLNVSSLQTGQLFAPYFAGLLMDRGEAATPFVLAACFQMLAVWSYKASFREPSAQTDG